MAGILIAMLLTLLQAAPAMAGGDFNPSSVEKGVFLVASPSLNDPNFRETVVLILEHGAQGTLGLILNRATSMLLSEALPEVSALKGTTHRLFAGGPVQPADASVHQGRLGRLLGRFIGESLAEFQQVRDGYSRMLVLPSPREIRNAD